MCVCMYVSIYRLYNTSGIRVYNIFIKKIYCAESMYSMFKNELQNCSLHLVE